MNNNIIQNEYDIFTEIYNNIDYFKDFINKIFELKHKKEDKDFIISQFQITTNIMLNLALQNNMTYDYFDYNNIKNKILPDNYFKPNQQILNIIKNIYGLNQENLNKIEKEINQLKKEQNND